MFSRTIFFLFFTDSWEKPFKTLEIGSRSVISVTEKTRIALSPTACVNHDREKYTIEVELAGVDKKNVNFEMTKTTFCLRAPRNDTEHFGCWVLAHAVNSNKAKATFKNGLLTVTAPLAESFKGVKLSIE